MKQSAIWLSVLSACVSVASLAAQARLTAKDVEAFRKHSRLAVVVSVQEYADSQTFPKLGFANKDAGDLSALLETQGFRVHRMLTNGDPNVRQPLSAGAIYDQVRRMCDDADADDTILFFFSGHGFANAEKVSFLCPHQCDAGDLENTAVAIEKVAKMMSEAKAKKAILIADACRNIPGKSAERDRKLREYELAEGVAVLFSTAPGSRSYEPSGDMRDGEQPIQNGLFTHFLLRGLRGAADGALADADGFVTFREVAHWVGKRLKEFPNVEQKSWMNWNGGADDDIWLTEVEPKPPVAAAQADREQPPANGGTPNAGSGASDGDGDTRPAAPPDKPAAAPKVAKSNIRIRFYHEVTASAGRTKMERIKERLEAEGYTSVEFINLGRRGMPEAQQLQRFVGDSRLTDLKAKSQKHVYFAEQLAPYVDELRKIFGKQHDFTVRPAQCRQRVAEGDAVDLTIDWIGLPDYK